MSDEETPAEKARRLKAEALDEIKESMGLKPKKKTPKSCITTCMELLKDHAPRVAWNEFQYVEEIDNRVLEDQDITDFNIVAEERSGIPITESHVRRTIETFAHRNPYHPVKKWLANLPSWDKVHRVDKFFHMYCGTQLNEYTTGVSRVILIGAVKRMLHPGQLFRYMPIIVGKQLAGKSTMLKKLFGDWHYSSQTDLGSEKICFEIQGSWCMEVGELHAYSRSDIESVKDFISRQEDRFRKPWGRVYIQAKRCLIIIGTANKEEFLRDETGDSRFLPVNIGNAEVDVEGVERDRDQLFAEAFARRNESVWLEGGAKHMALTHQEAAREVDDWEGIVDHWLRGRGTDDPITTLQVLLGPLQFDASHINRAAQNRVGACLRRLKLIKHPDTRVRQWLIPSDYPREAHGEAPF
jgi:predicted P-loop ATPase